VDAFGKLEAGDSSAMPAFAALLGVRGDDQLVNFRLGRLLNGAPGTRIMLD
jgi:adenylate cyclase